MRFLLSMLALLALLGAVTAQVRLPLTSLAVVVTGASAGSTVPPNPSLLPDFSLYGQESLRYSAEIEASRPVNIAIRLGTQSIGGASPTSITVRNCGSTLFLPTTTSAGSQCDYITAQTFTHTPGSSILTTIPFNNILGTQNIELLTKAELNGAVTDVRYVITIGVFTGAGTLMMSLDTRFTSAIFDKPFVTQTSQYTISFYVQQSTNSLNVPFYLATQRTVNTVFVQECPGLSCDNCPLSTARKQITTPGRTSGVSADSTFVWTNRATGQHGRYFFPASVPVQRSAQGLSNCLRFINQIDDGTLGKNEYTITISMPISNCGVYTTCADCANDDYCGWCLTDNFVANRGSCRVGGNVALSFASTDTVQSCSPQSGLVIPRYVIDPSGCVVVIRGDPRISGLQGQDFQVHGSPNEYFNLVTSSSMQVNSRFVYLDEAKCDNFTTCFSHPGTYIDEVGVMMGEDKVRIAASAIGESARVFINGKEVLVSSHKHTAGKILVTFANPRRIVVKTPEFMMTISQSDKFFNIDSALLKTSLLDQGSKLLKLETSRAAEANTIMHGLIGQTWRNNIYAGGREYEGEVTDYQVADGIWGTDFAFNLYKN